MSIIHDILFNLSFGLFTYILPSCEVSLKKKIITRTIIVHNSENRYQRSHVRVWRGSLNTCQPELSNH